MGRSAGASGPDGRDGQSAPSLTAPVMAASFGVGLGLISGLLALAAVCISLIDAESRNQALE